MDDLSAAVAQDFGAKVRKAREAAGLSQEALADLSGMSRTVISPLERGGHMPRLDTVIKLAGALGLEPCQLMTDYRWHPPTQGPVVGRFRRASES